MYPACLIGSRAVALTGVRTRLGLLADRLTSNHSGHQVQGAFIDPVSPSRIWSKIIDSYCRDLVTVCIESLLVVQQAPGDACQLVGKVGGQLVAMHPWRCVVQPRSEAKVAPVMWSHQDEFSGLNEQASQIPATPFWKCHPGWIDRQCCIVGYQAEPR